MCFFFLHESEVQESWKTFFPPFPPLWLYFHLPDGGCALTFAGINLPVHLDFPSLICLNKINGHSCGQIYPKLELSLLGIPANRATQSETPPTAITDSTMLSKGTWSINAKKLGRSDDVRRRKKRDALLIYR